MAAGQEAALGREREYRAAAQESLHLVRATGGTWPPVLGRAMVERARHRDTGAPFGHVERQVAFALICF